MSSLLRSDEEERINFNRNKFCQVTESGGLPEDAVLLVMAGRSRHRALGSSIWTMAEFQNLSLCEWLAYPDFYLHGIFTCRILPIGSKRWAKKWNWRICDSIYPLLASRLRNHDLMSRRWWSSLRVPQLWDVLRESKAGSSSSSNRPAEHQQENIDI